MYAVAHDPDADSICNERSRAIRDLLLSLESLDGPDLWVGTSYRMLNFHLRDATHESDYIPTFGTVHALASPMNRLDADTASVTHGRAETGKIMM